MIKRYYTYATCSLAAHIVREGRDEPYQIATVGIKTKTGGYWVVAALIAKAKFGCRLLLYDGGVGQ